MTQKPSATQSASGDALYDSIMARLEPDLTSENIDTLDEKYAGESETEYELRMERYEAAFEECDRILTMMDDGMVLAAREVQEQKHKKMLKKEAAEKAEDVSEAEAKLDSLDEE